MPKGKTKSGIISEAPPLILEEEPQFDAPGEAKEAPKRISIPLNGDGSIDLSTMREKTKDQLTAAIHRTKGFTGASGAPVVPALSVDRNFVPMMYDSLCASLRLVGGMFFKWPEDLTKFMQFSEDEKDKLKEPTALVIEKYAPVWLLTHQEEAALLQAIIIASQSMVGRAVQSFVAERRAQASQTVETQPLQ